MHMAYAAQQRLDSYNEATQHANGRKAAFDRRVVKKGGVVTFEKGQLVQTYRNDLASSLSTARKIEPMWTGPWRVKERLLNSYTLESLEGEPLKGDYNARRLREFVPREGTELAREQKDFEARQEEVGDTVEVGENEEVGDKEVDKEVEITPYFPGDRDVA
jgi:hypothetical protein